MVAGHGDFSQDSIKGTYAISNVGRGGQAPLAALGIFTADGNGKFQVLVSANLPTPTFNERQFISLPEESGTYKINPDGTGTLSVAGANNPAVFVVTDSQIIGEVKIATEIQIIDGGLSPSTGNLRPPLIKRLPKPDTFTEASLFGRFAVVGTGNGRNTPDGFVGIVNFDGIGNLSGTITSNLPTPAFPERQNISTSVDGVYKVNSNGTGTAFDGFGEVLFDFIINETKSGTSDVTIGKEFFGIYRNLTPATGNLSTFTAKKRQFCSS